MTTTETTKVYNACSDPDHLAWMRAAAGIPDNVPVEALARFLGLAITGTRRTDHDPAAQETAERASVMYDPDSDNCAGGCARGSDQRVAFHWLGELHFACPGCYEAILGGPPADLPVITLTSEQVHGGLPT